MAERYRELGFDTLLALVSGATLAAYMLGIVLDPIPAVAVGSILVVGGVLALVPSHARATATVIGLVTVGLAGAVIPRAVSSIIAPPAANELAIALAGSGLVLLLTFALLRLTVFDEQHQTPA